jgi:hypothetical protein
MDAQIAPQNGDIVILFVCGRDAIDVAAKSTANGNGFASGGADQSR